MRSERLRIRRAAVPPLRCVMYSAYERVGPGFEYPSRGRGFCLGLGCGVRVEFSPSRLEPLEVGVMVYRIVESPGPKTIGHQGPEKGAISHNTPNEFPILG